MKTFQSLLLVFLCFQPAPFEGKSGQLDQDLLDSAELAVEVTTQIQCVAVCHRREESSCNAIYFTEEDQECLLLSFTQEELLKIGDDKQLLEVKRRCDLLSCGGYKTLVTALFPGIITTTTTATIATTTRKTTTITTTQTTTTTTATTATTAETAAMTCLGDDTCCDFELNGNQCGFGQGDCDFDEDCQGPLVCGKDNCDLSNPRFDSNDDCCEYDCPVISDCCNRNNQCAEGFGDCDSDVGCQGDLLCAKNNCDLNNSLFDETDDCCVSRENYICTGKSDCCTDKIERGLTCDFGEGDCDSDSECKDGLTCGQNNCDLTNPRFEETDDCCE